MAFPPTDRAISFPRWVHLHFPDLPDSNTLLDPPDLVPLLDLLDPTPLPDPPDPVLLPDSVPLPDLPYLALLPGLLYTVLLPDLSYLVLLPDLRYSIPLPDPPYSVPVQLMDPLRSKRRTPSSVGWSFGLRSCCSSLNVANSLFLRFLTLFRKAAKYVREYP